MRFSVECTFPHLRKRGVASRKSALCNLDLTEKRTLRVQPHGKAHSVPAAHQKARSARERPPRLRLYVRRRGQNALFRRVRFSSPAQTWRRLTEKRTLRVKPHGKAHPAAAPGRDVTKRRTLHVTRRYRCPHRCCRRCHLRCCLHRCPRQYCHPRCCRLPYCHLRCCRPRCCLHRCCRHCRCFSQS